MLLQILDHLRVASQYSRMWFKGHAATDLK